MKYKIALLLICLPGFLEAQKASEIDNVANKLLTDLKESWTLGVDSNTNSVDIGMYNKYKNLFEEAAKVADDLNFQFVPGKDEGIYKIFATPKDFDVYAHDAALQVSKLRVDFVGEFKKLDIPDSNIYEVRRTIYAEKPAKYVFQDINRLARTILDNHPDIKFDKRKGSTEASNRQKILNALKEELQKNPDNVYKFISTSTLRVSLAFTAGAGNVFRIISINQLDSKVTCVNDDDGDGILNSADIMPRIYGDFTASGAPDDDLDGVADVADQCLGTYGTVHNNGCPESYFFTNRQLDGSIGLQFNDMKLKLPDLDQLGYHDVSGADATDVLQSKKGNLDNPTPVPGIYAAGNFTYFFGKATRHTGISAGFSYARFLSGYDLSDSIIYTYKSFDGYDSYRRQITIGSMTEKMAFNVINVPIQLNYRFKIDRLKTWILTIKAGPSFTLITGSTDYKSSIDVGGIYQVDTVNKNKIAYYDYFDKGSTWNVYMTSGGINQQSSSPGAAFVFDRLNGSGGYDFASNKIYRDQKKIFRLTWALNCSLEGQYKKNNNSPVALMAGIHFSYAPSIGGKDKYIPIERTTDDYNSIFNSNGKSFYLAYGIILGLAYSF